MTEKETPENAQVIIEQDLFDPENPSGRIAVTAHTGDGQTACNTWIRENGSWRRLLPERVVPGKPDRFMMADEVIRFQDKSGAEKDLRLHLVIKSALNSVDEMFEK